MEGQGKEIKKASRISVTEAETAEIVLNYLNSHAKYASSAKFFEKESRVTRSVLLKEPNKRMKNLESIVAEYISLKEKESKQRTFVTSLGHQPHLIHQMNKVLTVMNDYVAMREALDNGLEIPQISESEQGQTAVGEEFGESEVDPAVIGKLIEDQRFAELIAREINDRMNAATPQDNPIDLNNNSTGLSQYPGIAENILSNMESNGLLDSIYDDNLGLDLNSQSPPYSPGVPYSPPPDTTPATEDEKGENRTETEPESKSSRDKTRPVKPIKRTKSPEKRKASESLPPPSSTESNPMPPPPPRRKPKSKTNSYTFFSFPSPTSIPNPTEPSSPSLIPTQSSAQVQSPTSTSFVTSPITTIQNTDSLPNSADVDNPTQFADSTARGTKRALEPDISGELHLQNGVPDKENANSNGHVVERPLKVAKLVEISSAEIDDFLDLIHED